MTKISYNRNWEKEINILTIFNYFLVNEEVENSKKLLEL